MGFIVKGKHIDFKDFDALRQIGGQLSYIEPLIELLIQWYNPAITRFPFQTSGSTGTPKTIYHNRKAIVQSAKYTQKYFDYKTGDKSLLALPLGFVAGRMMVLRSLISNLDLHLEEVSGNAFERITYPIDFVAVTPYQLMQSLILSPEKLKQVKTVLLGGGPVSLELNKLIENLSSRIYLSYGMTETLTHVAVRQMNGEKMGRIYESVSSDISFTINEDSCLIIEAPHLSESVETRDLVHLIDDQHFYWLGRKDNIINSGGIKINPEPIEALLMDALRFNCLILGLPDPGLGEKAILLIESDASALRLDQINKVISQLEKNKRPKAIAFVDAFCYTDTGKVSRLQTLQKIKNENLIQL